MKEDKVIYYSSEAEEVMHFRTPPAKIDENYKYIHTNCFFNLWSKFVYRFISTPFSFLTFKTFKRVKFYNTQVLKNYKNCGYFIYANHTNQYGDGFCPALICFPKKPHIIVSSENINIPFLKHFSKISGALPLPDSISATKNFYSAMETILNENNPIVIYPEAHLWPYYTKIRNFPSSSFRYPVKFDKPVFTFTTVYKKSKHKKPKTEIYVDGPFFPERNLNIKDAQQKLRDEVFFQMCERSKLNDCEYIKYKQRGAHD